MSGEKVRSRLMDAKMPEAAGARQPPAIKTVAVIDIGATSIRMAIGEIGESGSVRTLDTLSQAVSLGKDTFSDNVIRKSTMEECVRVLAPIGNIVEQYRIKIPDNVRVVATSAVREARNRLAFIDRVYIATGLVIDPIDEAEVNRVTYLGVQPYLRNEPALAHARTVVVEIGGGSTELLLVANGNVIAAYTFRIGSLRLRKALEAYNAPAAKIQHVMASQIQRMVDEVREQVAGDGPVEMIALGGDMRFAAAQLLQDWRPDQLTRLPVAALADFTSKLITLSDDRIVHRHHLSFPEAETVGPALLSYVMLARGLNVDNVLITNTNLRDGLLHEMAVGQAWTQEFRQQIVRSALNLGNKYDFDEAHACHVARLASRLFEQLQSEHQLDSRHEVVLHVAALLHEIGAFVSNRSMHKHSMYLIRNSEIFGLGKRNLLLVALVARYHRRASPQPMHEGYATLAREERVAVAKMAALLRVAVALDESRSQRIHDFTCHVEGSRLVISIARAEDLSLEQLAHPTKRVAV